MVKVQVGDPVVYVDPTGAARPALVTAAWSALCVNVVFASGDQTRTDSYGRQIERATSCMHASTPGRAFGNFWYAASVDEAIDASHKPERSC